jgi:YHS domain-containing protein
MSEYTDMQDMMDILAIAIAREECEERFFRRSAEASSGQIARAMFSEIADDFKRYYESLEARKEKLLGALADLEKAEKGKLGGKTEGPEVAKEKDPVCGMEIDKETCKLVSTYKDKNYRFCSADCKKAFELEPEKYGGSGDQEAAGHGGHKT